MSVDQILVDCETRIAGDFYDSSKEISGVEGSIDTPDVDKFVKIAGFGITATEQSDGSMRMAIDGNKGNYGLTMFGKNLLYLPYELGLVGGRRIIANFDFECSHNSVSGKYVTFGLTNFGSSQYGSNHFRNFAYTFSPTHGTYGREDVEIMGVYDDASYEYAARGLISYHSVDAPSSPTYRDSLITSPAITVDATDRHVYTMDVGMSVRFNGASRYIFHTHDHYIDQQLVAHLVVREDYALCPRLAPFIALIDMTLDLYKLEVYVV